MKVSEQIDAMEASAVDPYKFLVATRVLACMLMLPLLTVVDGKNFYGSYWESTVKTSRPSRSPLRHNSRKREDRLEGLIASETAGLQANVTCASCSVDASVAGLRPGGQRRGQYSLLCDFYR
jgi:hypothetical protein